MTAPNEPSPEAVRLVQSCINVARVLLCEDEDAAAYLARVSDFDRSVVLVVLESIASAFARGELTVDDLADHRQQSTTTKCFLTLATRGMASTRVTPAPKGGMPQ
jgi:hypothetical protein